MSSSNLTGYLEQIKKRLSDAPAGPWHRNSPDGQEVFHGNPLDKSDEYSVCDCENPEAADLIASAPSDLAKLVRVVELLREGLAHYSTTQMRKDGPTGNVAHVALKEADAIVGEK